MTDQATIAQAITQAAVEAMEGALQAMAADTGEGSSGTRCEPRSTGPKLCSTPPIMKKNMQRFAFIVGSFSLRVNIYK